LNEVKKITGGEKHQVRTWKIISGGKQGYTYLRGIGIVAKATCPWEKESLD
jgi:hypothetical protein